MGLLRFHFHADEFYQLMMMHVVFLLTVLLEYVSSYGDLLPRINIAEHMEDRCSHPITMDLLLFQIGCLCVPRHDVVDSILSTFFIASFYQKELIKRKKKDNLS